MGLGLLARPAACPACIQSAVALQADTTVHQCFLRMVLLSMFSKAGGYKQHHRYVDDFELRWWDHCPEQVICAAKASLYAPDFSDVQQWCRQAYPTLDNPGTRPLDPCTIGKLCCCESAWILLTSKQLRLCRLVEAVQVLAGKMHLPRKKTQTLAAQETGQAQAQT